jgi:hypothetical protein
MLVTAKITDSKVVYFSTLCRSVYVNSVRLNLNVCTRPHDCIVLLWLEAIACANKVLLY